MIPVELSVGQLRRSLSASLHFGFPRDPRNTHASPDPHCGFPAPSVDVPVQKGHVLMLATNPVWRGETIGS